MPIPEFHYYHGAAISQIISARDFTGLARFGEVTGGYAINHNIGLYIKHSTLRHAPWRFNFRDGHQDAVRSMFNHYKDKLYLALICGDVGICLLTYGEYASVIDENFEEQENLTVHKPRGGSFRISGAVGKLGRTIPLNRFPGFIFS